MSSIETLKGFFVEQRFPYGEPSGMYRLVTGVICGEDGNPVRILANDLYPFPEALSVAQNLRQNGVEPFKV